MFAQPEFWVAVGFVAVVAVLWRPAAKQVAAGLDARATRIKSSLDEARTLAEEAQKILAEHQRKQREAAKECERIVEHAREEAERLTREAHARLEAELRRRVQLAREKIALAETEAAREVRNVAVEVAIAATRALIVRRLDRAGADRLLESSIAELPQRLH